MYSVLAVKMFVVLFIMCIENVTSIVLVLIVVFQLTISTKALECIAVCRSYWYYFIRFSTVYFTYDNLRYLSVFVHMQRLEE